MDSKTMMKHLYNKGNVIRLLIGLVVIVLGGMKGKATVLPDSIVNEDGVYYYMLSDTHKAEQIMAELRKRGKQPKYDLDMVEGDLYYNTGRSILGLRQYLNALRASEVKKDAELYMKLLHRVISCYDEMHDEVKKVTYVKLLLAKADAVHNQAMESVALFYLGKSLYYQGNKVQGYQKMQQAVKLMKASSYDRKYDNLRANYNDLLIFYERDQRFADALKVLGELKNVLDRVNGDEAEMEGLYSRERRKWAAHAAVVYSKMGDHEKEADAAYQEFLKSGKKSGSIDYLIIPYLLGKGKQAEVLRMCRERERMLIERKDTVSLYMASTLKFAGEASSDLGNYHLAASYFARLAVIRDSVKVREQQSTAQELSQVYDMTEKEEQLMQSRMVTYAVLGVLVVVLVLGGILLFNYRMMKRKNLSLMLNIKEALRYKEELKNKEASLSREFREQETVKLEKNIDADEALFRQVHDYIVGEELFKQLQLSRNDLMERFQIPANKFAGLFTKYAGRSFSDYITDLRIGFVAEQLMSGKYTSVGKFLQDYSFMSSSSLYRAFTRKFGMSPQKFIKMKGNATVGKYAI